MQQRICQALHAQGSTEIETNALLINFLLLTIRGAFALSAGIIKITRCECVPTNSAAALIFVINEMHFYCPGRECMHI